MNLDKISILQIIPWNLNLDTMVRQKTKHPKGLHKKGNLIFSLFFLYTIILLFLGLTYILYTNVNNTDITNYAGT